MKIHMRTPGNAAMLEKVRTATYRQHKIVRPWMGSNVNALVSILLSQRISPPIQARTGIAINMQNIEIFKPVILTGLYRKVYINICKHKI